MSYYVGASSHLTVEFTDLDGNFVDPATVTVNITNPAAVSASYSGIKDSVGHYHYDVTLNLAGVWFYVWTATSPAAAQYGSLTVVPQEPLSAWTYSGNPLSSQKDEVRFLISDTVPNRTWNLLDAEINYAIAQYPDNILLAAAVCAESILSKFKGFPQQKSLGDLSLSYSQQFTFYEKQAFTLRQRANLKGVKAYIGGTSVAEKSRIDADADRVQPAVKIDGQNYASPTNALTGDTPGIGP